MNNNLSASEVVTGVVRLSFLNVFTARPSQNGGEPKFSATLLIPKSDVATYQRIMAAIEAATVDGMAKKWDGQRPPVVPHPLHDGDGVRPSDGAPFGPECKGHWVITATSNQNRPPQLRDGQLNPILDQTALYSGAYAHVFINFFAYKFAGRKGIGCGLRAIQKVRDGEALGGTAKDANDVFNAIPMATPQPAYLGAATYTPPTSTPGTFVPQQTTPAPQIDPITGMPSIPRMGM